MPLVWHAQAMAMAMAASQSQPVRRSPLVGHHLSQNGYRFEIINPTVDSIGMEVLRPIFHWEVK